MHDVNYLCQSNIHIEELISRDKIMQENCILKKNYAETLDFLQNIRLPLLAPHITDPTHSSSLR